MQYPGVNLKEQSPSQYQRAGTQAATGAVPMTDCVRDNAKVCEIAEELTSAMRQAERHRNQGPGGDLDSSRLCRPNLGGLGLALAPGQLIVTWAQGTRNTNAGRFARRGTLRACMACRSFC
jgi:hypothetical protein